jgi:hypothetical protein
VSIAPCTWLYMPLSKVTSVYLYYTELICDKSNMDMAPLLIPIHIL